ncbi:MAG: hypothetical protein Q4D79_09730 [Propionibacteriaceae bacterium]|nr:hypothetical protein [Propionibacteriaceae bacterium]
MVASPYYDRLRAVADLSHFDLFEAIDFTVARVNLNKARELVGQVQANPGISGDVKKAIGERLQKDIDAFDLHEKNIEKLRESHNRARGFMMEAKKFCESLSPDLLSPFESGLRDVTKMVSWMGVTMPVEAYLNEVEGQKNAEREKLAKKALDTMNRQLHNENSSPILPKENIKSTDDPSSDSQASKEWKSRLSDLRNSGGPGGGFGGGGGGSSPVAPGAGLGAGAAAAAPIAASQVGKLMPGGGGVLRPTPVDGGALTPSPGRGKVVTTPGSPSPGKGSVPGVGTSPEWPRDALKYPIGGKVTSDGPVGGYTPAPVSDINDPRWRSDFTHPALGGANATKAGGIVGGLVGSGAGALAARGAGGIGVGGATGMGGMMMPPGMGAGSAGAAGTRGTGAVSGSTRGSARASSSAATARNSAMRPGAGGMGMAGGHGAAGARGGSKDEKKNRNLIGYQVVRIEDDEAAGPVDSSAFGAGDVSSLKPMKSEESDKW